MNKILLSLLTASILCSCAAQPESDKQIPSPEPTPAIQDQITTPNPQTISMKDPLTLPEFTTFWDLTSTDGNASLISTFDTIKIALNSAGSSISSVQTYHDALPLVKGTSYQISFDLSSTFDRPVEVFMMNCDNSNVLFHEIINATSQPVHYDFEFKVKETTSWNGRLAINTGSFDQNGYPYHEVNLSNLMYKETKHPVSEPTIKTSHPGYLPSGNKKVILPFEQGDFIQVIDVNTGNPVLTAPVVRKIQNASTKETNFTADISALTTPGTYMIRSQLNGYSHQFEIRSDLLQPVLQDTVRMFYYQRCGSELSGELAGDLAHGLCHITPAQVYGTDQIIDVNGGWHDAGDYGRYVVTGSKAAIDLMLAYELNPDVFTDTTRIPESNNEVPDILDEIRIELEWMFKMQNSWGGVYDKVVTSKFPDFIMPDQDQQPLFVMQEMTTATADFVAVMAFASLVYKDIDPVFAQHCLNAAIKSWDYLQTATLSPYKNPDDFSAGYYMDKSDIDERYLASCAMYAATSDQKYLKNVRQLFKDHSDQLNGVHWKQMGSYGTYLILQYSDLKSVDPSFFNDLLAHFIHYTETLLDATSNDGYFISLYNNYTWGSNGELANNGLVFALGNQLVDNVNYRTRAADHLYYLLGRNSLDFNFVTGNDPRSPKHLHHRPSIAAHSLLPGALVGGANSAPEDPVTIQNFNSETPVAKCYFDHQDSFSTNEIAIYWNSTLAALLSAVDSNDR